MNVKNLPYQASITDMPKSPLRDQLLENTEEVGSGVLDIKGLTKSSRETLEAEPSVWLLKLKQDLLVKRLNKVAHTHVYIHTHLFDNFLKNNIENLT